MLFLQTKIRIYLMGIINIQKQFVDMKFFFVNLISLSETLQEIKKYFNLILHFNYK